MRVLLLAAFLTTTTSQDGPPPPGVLRDQWLQGFQNMKKLKDSRHPKAINDPAFFMELARASYHTGELWEGVGALEAASALDPSRALEFIGMECDLHYHLSRKNASCLPAVSKCLRKQYQMDLNVAQATGNPQQEPLLLKDVGFWQSYSGVLSDMGKYGLAVTALERAQEAAAAAAAGSDAARVGDSQNDGSKNDGNVSKNGGNGNGIGLTNVVDPHWIQLIAKAQLSGGHPLKALATLGPHLEEWAAGLTALMAHRGLSDPPEVAVQTAVQTTTSASDEHLGSWVADAWSDASLAHLVLGQLDEALHCIQTALTLHPNTKAPHGENYHQTLARIYLELGRLDLAKASLWGIADLTTSTSTTMTTTTTTHNNHHDHDHHAQQPAEQAAAHLLRSSQQPSALLAKGFEQAALHFRRTGQQVVVSKKEDLTAEEGDFRRTAEQRRHRNRGRGHRRRPSKYSNRWGPEAEVLLQHLAVVGPGDPASFYFGMARLANLAPEALSLVSWGYTGSGSGDAGVGNGGGGSDGGGGVCLLGEALKLDQDLDPNWLDPEPRFLPATTGGGRTVLEDALEADAANAAAIIAFSNDALEDNDDDSDAAHEEEEEEEDISAQKPLPPVKKGAIVYLCCADEKEARDLELSLALLARFYLARVFPTSSLVSSTATTAAGTTTATDTSNSSSIVVQPTPVLVLHDFLTDKHIDRLRTVAEKALHTLPNTPHDFDPSSTSHKDQHQQQLDQQSQVQHQQQLDLRFIYLEAKDWQPHQQQQQHQQGELTSSSSSKPNPNDAASSSRPIPHKVFGYGMGYRHMCRLFSGPPLADLPALQSFSAVMRMDTDSFLLGPVLSDPLSRVLGSRSWQKQPQQQKLHKQAQGRDDGRKEGDVAGDGGGSDGGNGNGGGVLGVVTYAWIGAFADQSYFTTDLLRTTEKWLDSPQGAAALESNQYNNGGGSDGDSGGSGGSGGSGNGDHDRRSASRSLSPSFGPPPPPPPPPPLRPHTAAAARASLHEWLSPHLEKVPSSDGGNVGGVGSSGSSGGGQHQEQQVQGKNWDDVRMCFATNFFAVDLSWWRSPAYRSYFSALEQAGGFYEYRWGDACVHFLAVAAMLDKETEVVRLHHELPYWHQGTVAMPDSPFVSQSSPF